MSKPQGLLTLLLVTGAGIASGIYIFNPSLKELAKGKQLSGQTEFAEQHSSPPAPEALEKPQEEPAAEEIADSIASNPQSRKPPKQSFWSAPRRGDTKVEEKVLSFRDGKDSPR